jgi:hypothetical protein
MAASPGTTCRTCNGQAEIRIGQQVGYPGLDLILRACTECEDVEVVHTQGTLRKMAQMRSAK